MDNRRNFHGHIEGRDGWSEWEQVRMECFGCAWMMGETCAGQLEPEATARGDCGPVQSTCSRLPERGQRTTLSVSDPDPSVQAALKSGQGTAPPSKTLFGTEFARRATPTECRPRRHPGRSRNHIHGLIMRGSRLLSGGVRGFCAHASHAADVIIVGGGHNGLVAATLLARQGLQVR